MSKTRILHIGDLHYNSQLEGQYLKQARDQIFSPLNDDKDSFGPYDLVVMSGDIAESGLGANLKEGFKFLRELIEKVGSPPLLLCLGNHDGLRPIPDENFCRGIVTGIFDNFIAEFDSIKSLLTNEIVCPIIPYVNPPKKEDVVAALDALVAADFDRSKLDDAAKYLLPFFWIKEEKNVFCYLLSTVDFSAVPYGKKYLKPLEILKMLNKIKDGVFDVDRFKNDVINAGKSLMPSEILEMLNQTKDETFDVDRFKKTVLMRDIPYVQGAQFNVLKWVVDYFNQLEDTKDDFISSTKIAISHYPLVLLPDEAGIREFDSVANGPFIAAKLSKLGFSILLYGHKHVPRISVNFGNWTNGSIVNTKEFVGICGDRLFGREGMTPPKFPILEIEDIDKDRFFERAVSIKIISEREPLLDPQKLISFDRTGNLKRIYCENRSLISRHQTINEKFWNLVEKAEERFLSNTESAWTTDYKDAEAFLFEFIDFLDGYCEGIYGLDEDFILQLEEDLNDADALYFIDKLESPAWAHPNFMHHLALQMKAYAARNHEQLKSRSWSHSEPVERALIRLKCHTGREIPNKESDKISLPDSPILPLDLDICRILIWDEEKLKTVCGRILIILHKVFQIPLFHLSKQLGMQYFEKHQLRKKQDFHLILKGTDVECEFYDETKSKDKRIRISKGGAYLNLYKDLLEDENLDPAARKAGLEKGE